MSLTQTVDTYSAPEGRMIKREAPYIGEYVALKDYEALREALGKLREDMDALRKELHGPVAEPVAHTPPPPVATPAPAPVKAVFHPKAPVMEN